MSVEIETRGLEDAAAFFKAMPEVAQRAAVFAVNDTAAFARVLSSKEIREQVRFTATYLNKDGRLTITKRAHGIDTEAVVTGRNRATSLTQFASTPVSFGRKKGRRGIRVRVSAQGSGTTLKSAFYVQLKNNNVGLAMRTADSRPPSRGAVPIFGGEAWLLYGPSVGQVFYDVASEVSPAVGDNLQAQFVRQFERLTNGR